MKILKTTFALIFLLVLCFCCFGCTEYYNDETGLYDETYIPPFVSTEEITETIQTTDTPLNETTEALPETEGKTTVETEEITTPETEEITIAETEEITIAETEPVTTTENMIDTETVPTSEESESTEITENDTEKQEYLLNTNTKKFHLLSCKSGQKTKEENRAYYKGTKDEIISQGYSPCKNCKP